MTMVGLLDQADERLRGIKKQFDPQQGAEELAMQHRRGQAHPRGQRGLLGQAQGQREHHRSICSPDKREEHGKVMTGLRSVTLC